MTHDTLREQFKKLISENTLSHAYLFFGEDKEALLLFSKKLAYFLETGAFSIDGRPLSDTLIIKPDPSGVIGIGAARAVKNFLFSRPAVGKRRVAIIDQGECLTLEAQNALLKIAEEPPEKALLLVNIRDEAGLLPTVASRFQKVQIFSDAEKKTAKRQASSGERFMRAAPGVRSAMIKEILEDDEEKHAAVEQFLNELIVELHGHLPGSVRALAFVLRRKQLMGEYNTNMRLQLEAIAKVL